MPAAGDELERLRRAVEETASSSTQFADEIRTVATGLGADHVDIQRWLDVIAVRLDSQASVLRTYLIDDRIDPQDVSEVVETFRRGTGRVRRTLSMLADAYAVGSLSVWVGHQLLPLVERLDQLDLTMNNVVQMAQVAATGMIAMGGAQSTIVHAPTVNVTAGIPHPEADGVVDTDGMEFTDARRLEKQQLAMRSEIRASLSEFVILGGESGNPIVSRIPSDSTWEDELAKVVAELRVMAHDYSALFGQDSFFVEHNLSRFTHPALA